MPVAAAAARALASAWAPPGGWVAPSATWPAPAAPPGGTITQPTHGLGEVTARTPAASSTARSMCRWSAAPSVPLVIGRSVRVALTALKLEHVLILVQRRHRGGRHGEAIRVVRQFSRS